MSGIIARLTASAVTAAVLATAGAGAASAATAPVHAKPAAVTVNLVSPNVAEQTRIQTDLRAGDTLVFTGTDGRQYTAKLVGETVVVTAASTAHTVHPMYNPCTVAVSAGLLAIGAAGLTALSVFTGGITVAGIFIAAGTLGQLAAIAGSFAALEAFVALYVC